MSAREAAARGAGREPLLSIRDLKVAYGKIEAVHGLSFDVFPGEIVTLLGANGAGKTTILNAISGIVRPSSGSILYRGSPLAGMAPDRIVRSGIAHVPEGRRIFPNLTIRENLRLASYIHRGERGFDLAARLGRVFELFPRLAERASQPAGTLSGGEQQMLAIGRALVTGGEVLMLDEPSMGIAPIVIKEIFSTISEISRSGTTILLVEQNARQALRIASYCYVLETGRITFDSDPETAKADRSVVASYLGA